MTTEYETRPTRLTVAPKGSAIFAERATHIEIDDEGGGEFVVIRQTGNDDKANTLRVDADEWEPLVAAVNRLLADIAKRAAAPEGAAR